MRDQWFGPNAPHMRPYNDGWVRNWDAPLSIAAWQRIAYASAIMLGGVLGYLLGRAVSL